MAPEQRAVGDNHMIGHPRVMPHVAMRHQKIVRTDDRFLGFCVRPVHRDMFAKNVVVADAQTRRLALVFQVLRRLANHAAGVEGVVRAGGRVSSQMRVRPDAAIRAKHHMLVNDRARTDADGRIELCL